MELWIRTPDKLCLTKVNHLYINDCNIKQQNDLILATYKTKERALEVLDEIQSILRTEPLVIVGSNEEKIEYKELSTYVYQMPEE